MITINNPDLPATKKQLWLLHILTKQDTRNLKLTMQQASDRINDLKQSNNRPLVNPKASAIKQDKQLRQQKQWDKQFSHLTGYGLNIGKLRIVQAFKEICKHYDDSICVSLKASGIFPGGKKQHIISDMPCGNDDICIRPLFAQIRTDVTVTREQYYNWIASVPVKFTTLKSNSIPESWRDKALSLAKSVNKPIAIFKMEI